MLIQNSVLERVVNADIIGGVFNIPSSVTSIGNYAFWDCTRLTSIIIPSKVTSIGKRAFEDCTGLTSIGIPTSVKSIGGWAFNGCTRLTSITIPESVKSIGDSAFSGCTRLTSITIPESVKSIGNYAFWDCARLTSIAIPASVTKIGYSAFSGCTRLTSTNVNKLEIIDLAISLLPSHDGLCSCLDRATRIMSMRCGQAICVQSTFPNFTQEIAIAKFGGRMNNYWWPVEDKASRLSFLEWLRNN